MAEKKDPNNTGLKAGQSHAGFTIQRVAALDIIDGFLYELIHAKTHARYMHISRSDQENVFGVAFKTVPQDSTGVAAFTASDWTMYPFATQNRKDFYNLMDVYLDAAFFPKIDELSFKQEGHRIEFKLSEAGQPTEDLVYKGVVFNEMKGAMSSPDQVRGCLQ